MGMHIAILILDAFAVQATTGKQWGVGHAGDVLDSRSVALQPRSSIRLVDRLVDKFSNLIFASDLGDTVLGMPSSSLLTTRSLALSHQIHPLFSFRSLSMPSVRRWPQLY